MKPCPLHSPVPRLLRGLFCACIVSLALPEGQAQLAPSAPSTPAATDEVIELSPFEVSADQDVGYVATNTLAGTRFSTALKDTPASISVMTSEFLSDIGAFQIEEAMEYAVNIEFFQDDDRDAINNNAVFTGYQSYRTRGLDASRSRNYFSSSGRVVPDEMAFVDRIEDSRGANAILFGIGQPGGVINTSTKQANVGRSFQKASVAYGSYDSKRATIDVNQPLMKGKLAVRLNLVYNDNNEFRHFVHQTHQRGLLSAKYQFSDRTRLTAEFERGQLESNKAVGFNLIGRAIPWMEAARPISATQTTNVAGTTRLNANNRRITFVANDESTLDMRGTRVASSGSGNVITDRTISDYSINFGGPGQNRFSRFGVLSAYFDHQLGKNTHMQLAFNHSEQSFDNRDPRGNNNALLGDPNQFLNGANQALNSGPVNPYAGDLYLETTWFRTVRWDISDTGRASLIHALDAKKWGDYRFAGVWEYDKQFLLSRTFREVWYDAATGQLGPFHESPENAQNQVWRRTYVTEQDWGSYHVTGPVGSGGLLENVLDPVNGRTLSSTWVRQGAPNESYTTQKTGMVVLQARYFNGHLLLGGGLRRDEFDSYRLATRRNPETQVFEVYPRDVASSNSAVGRTKTYGGVYHVPLPERMRDVEVSFYYNWSNNVAVPGAGNLMLHPSGDPLLEPIPVPKPENHSQDFSVGLGFFNGRLYLKATRYDTQARDQSVTSPSAVRTSNERIMNALMTEGLITQNEYDLRTEVGSQGLFGHQSKGHEIELKGNPMRSWNISLSYSKSDPLEHYRHAEWLRWEGINQAFLSKFDQNLVLPNSRTLAEEIEFIRDELSAQTRAVGVGKLGNRRHKYSAFTKYSFSSGPLKGAYVGGGYKHQSKMFTGPHQLTGEWLYGNSYWSADALAGYTVQGLKKGRKLSFQLNIFNVFNERDPLVTRYDSTNPNLVFREVVRAPSTWRLTTNFEY
jgi:iron complex outermembrane recepter protein